jgi:Co/Zn/Cd efflux system component
MSASCCSAPPPDAHRGNAAYKRVLWIVLAINASMFVVEIAAGVAAGSASLQADAYFLGDAGNYMISLAVVALPQPWLPSPRALPWACSACGLSALWSGMLAWAPCLSLSS